MNYKSKSKISFYIESKEVVILPSFASETGEVLRPENFQIVFPFLLTVPTQICLQI